MKNMQECENVLDESDVIEVVKNSIGKEFSMKEYAVVPASESVMGFLGEHYKLRVQVTVSRENRNLSYFVKKMPTKVPQHLDYALKTRAFYKETELYKTLFVDLKNAQKGTTDRTKWHPNYFYSRGPELFVLEDLSESGYYMYPERTLMDEEHLKASLRAMAAMHAASVIFEEKYKLGEVSSVMATKENNSTLRQLYSHLAFETEASDEKGHPGNTYHEAGIPSQLKIVWLLPHYTPQQKKLIEEKLPQFLRHYLQLVKPSIRFRNVFVHGDLWANNFMFRKRDDGSVCDSLIIDFQLARYAPPAHDLMMFLHLVQNNKFLDEHRQRILKYYYEAFSKELEKNRLDAPNCFPWETFLESCEFYEDLGLLCKLFYFQLILAPPAMSEKFLSSPEAFTKNMLEDRSEMVVECFLKDELCRTRVTEAMDAVIQKFILFSDS